MTIEIDVVASILASYLSKTLGNSKIRFSLPLVAPVSHKLRFFGGLKLQPISLCTTVVQFLQRVFETIL